VVYIINTSSSTECSHPENMERCLQRFVTSGVDMTVLPFDKLARQCTVSGVDKDLCTINIRQLIMWCFDDMAIEQPSQSCLCLTMSYCIPIAIYPGPFAQPFIIAIAQAIE